MSRKRKNFHYHYAEQFETREERLAKRRSKRRFAVPPLALVFSIVLLAVFGLVSTTFSVYVTTSLDDPEMPAQGGLVVNIKNGVNNDHPESTGIVRNNGDDLADSGAGGTVTNQTVYYTPYHGNDGTGWIKDNVTSGARYLYGDNYWQSANGADTGRTQGGQRVYSVTVQEKYGGLDQLYFRRSSLDSNTTNEQHAINGWSVTSNWSGKYYNGSSWGTYTADTYKVYNNGSALATLSFNSSTKKYTGSATLSAGTTYILNLYDGANYWANGGAGTLTATGSDTMYRYGSGGSGDGFSITPAVTATYSFEWTLSTAGNREDTGTFKVTFPTTYTVTFNANGHGTAPASQTVVSGGKATEPTAPTASGYTFGGWYKESSCTNKWNFTSDTVTSNKTLYAKWTANQYCTMSVDASKSLTLGTATALTFTTTNHSSGSVKITSADSTYVQVSSSSGGTYGTTATISGVSGTFYLKGLKPTSSPINVIVSCNAGHSNAVNSTCAVTVNEPTVTFDSLSLEEFKSDTLNITGRTPTPSSYSWSVDSTNSSLVSLSDQTATSVKVTAAAYSQATAKVKYTANYSTGYSKTFEATVSITESTISMKGSFDANWGVNHKLTYDAAANTSYGSYTNRGSNLYSCTLTLSGGQTYEFGINEGSTFYKNTGTITSDRTDCKIEVSNNNGWTFSTTAGSNCKITTGAGGSYTFYYNPSNNKLWLGEYPGLEYYLVGFGDWDEDEDTVMTKVSNTQYTYTKNFAAAQSYAYNTNNGFKIAGNDGSWYGYTNTISRTNTSVTMTTNGGNNAGFTSSYSGDYTFTFNPSTGALSVTFPTRSITVNAKLNTSNNILGSISNSNTSSSFFTITDNYNDTFTVTPKNHSQYQFTKWRDNNSTTGARTITVNSSTAVTYDTNWNYKSYTITYNTNGGTLASGTYDSVTTPNSVYKGSYTYGTGKTLPTASDITHATAPSLYSFGGWYANSNFTGSAITDIVSSETGNKTYYAKWNMEVVFKNNITGDTITTQTVADGSTASAPDLTDENADMSDLGFEFSGYSTPLTTTINYSWYHSNGDSNVIYVNYIPKSRDFSITLTPSANVTVDTSGEYDNYLIPFGATIAAHAEVAIPTGYDEDIYIKWIATINGVDYDADYYGDYSDDDPPTYYDDVNGKYVFDRADIVTLLTKVAPLGSYTLKAKAYYDIDGSTTVVSENYVSHTITYQIDSPMSGVAKTPDQKIYTVTAAPDVVASISTHSSISQTYLNLLTNYYKVAALSYDKAHTTTDKYDEIDGYEELDIEGLTSPFSATFDGVSIGVNYYKFKLKRLEDIDDTTSGLVDDSVSSSIRTVVGTNQGAATRPIYVANNSGNAFTGKRVMLFYTTDRGTLGYASSTSFNHATAAGGSTDREVYRFDIPDYVESVSIGVFDSSKEYTLPTLSGSTLNYTGTNFYTWSNWKEIDSSVQKINITGITVNGQISNSRITTGLLS